MWQLYTQERERGQKNPENPDLASGLGRFAGNTPGGAFDL